MGAIAIPPLAIAVLIRAVRNSRMKHSNNRLHGLTIHANVELFPHQSLGSVWTASVFTTYDKIDTKTITTL